LMDLNASQWCGLMDKRIHFKVKQVWLCNSVLLLFFVFCSTEVWTQNYTLGHCTIWAEPQPSVLLLLLLDTLSHLPEPKTGITIFTSQGCQGELNVFILMHQWDRTQGLEPGQVPYHWITPLAKWTLLAWYSFNSAVLSAEVPASCGTSLFCVPVTSVLTRKWSASSPPKKKSQPQSLGGH
jgi:hypothetical protein